MKALKEQIRKERIAGCQTPSIASSEEEEEEADVVELGEETAGPSKSPSKPNPDANQEDEENLDETSSTKRSVNSEREDPKNGGFMSVLTALCHEAADKSVKKTTWNVEKSTSIEACHEKKDKVEKCEICGKTTDKASTCFIARSYEVLKQV